MTSKAAKYYRNCRGSAARYEQTSVLSLAYDPHNISVFITEAQGLLYTDFPGHLKWSVHQRT